MRLVSVGVVLGVLLSACGVDPDYAELDIRYDGVPIRLDEGVPSDGENSPSAAGRLGELPGALAHTTETDDFVAHRVTNESDVTNGVATLESADDNPDEADPAAQPSPETVASAQDDLSATRRDSALKNFGDLVAGATTLSGEQVSCLVDEVEKSGVNPVPMNRVLRRALDEKTVDPQPRYVALANQAAAACGVPLTESILR